MNNKAVKGNDEKGWKRGEEKSWLRYYMSFDFLKHRVCLIIHPGEPDRFEYRDVTALAGNTKPALCRGRELEAMV
jgi:hypothetical protein